MPNPRGRSLTLALIIAAGCSGGSSPLPPAPVCHGTQPFPYPAADTYVGLHADRENNNVVACDGPAAVVEEWAALADTMIFQPIALSPSGDALYATASKTDGCKVFAVDTATGATRWCRDDFTLGVSGSSPEVDLDGNVYVTDGFDEETGGSALASITAGGELRWRTSLEGLAGSPHATSRALAGLHFTPGGHAATITPDGVVVLVDRASGAIHATFDMPAATGYVPVAANPLPIPGIPPYLQARLDTVVGPLTEDELAFILGASTGGSGAFSNNTIAVTSQSQLLAVGGGPDPEHGSLIAMDLDESSEPPRVTLRWTSVISGGSATSPAISADGGRAAIGDGASHIVYVDIAACNADTDADASVTGCAARFTYDLVGGSILGSMAVDSDGVVYAWNGGTDAAAPDLFALADDGGTPQVRWATNFTAADGFDRQWTSAATVLDDLVIGTVTTIRAAAGELLGIPIILDAYHEVVGVSRATGAVVWREPVYDDSINSLAIDPTGDIYVPLLGFLDLTSPNPNATYQGGVVKYRRTAE